jgi:diguanylate cyclase (GGDEF)-like protein
MKKNISQSILSRFIRIISAASLISIMITVVSHYLFIGKVVEFSKSKEAEQTLDVIQNNIAGEFQRNIETNLDFAETLFPTNYQKHSVTLAEVSFKYLLSQQHVFDSIAALTVQGNLIAQAYSEDSVLLQNPELATEQFSEIKEKLIYKPDDYIIFSGPTHTPKGQLFFAAKIIDRTVRVDTREILIIAFNMKDFYQAIDQQKIDNHAVTWVYAHDQTLLHLPKSEKLLNPQKYIFDNKAVDNKIIIKQSDIGKDSELTGLINIIVSLPKDIIQKSILQAVTAPTLFVFLSSLMVIIIAYFTAKKMLLPIQKLTSLSQEVAAGNFDVRMPDNTDDEVGALGKSFNMMIKELKEKRLELQKLVNRDILTQLPNRRQFEDHLTLLIGNGQRNNQSIAVIYIDLDQFKDTNDTFGHPAGDKLIKDVATRLLKNVRKGDLVARLGGDEFAIVLNPHKTKTDTEGVARKILDELSNPFIIEKHKVFSGGSIGISIYPEHGLDATSLVKNADAAMYEAKRSGRNNYKFYSKNLTEKSNERIVLGSYIRNAINTNEFKLFFQPKISLKTKEIIGAEALLRWKHQGEMIPPTKIVEISESSGFIGQIDTWVINKACQHIKEWQDIKIPIVPISINISGSFLGESQITDLLKTVLEKYSLDSKLLEIEITENELISNHQKTQQTLKTIHSLGVKIAIDDFGTGYSSLSYLKDFRADILKIDRKFVVNTMNNLADKEIAKAIVKLANALNMEVVVEGIETTKQEELFLEFGARSGQGYLYSKPLPEKEFQALLTNSFEARVIR